MTWKHGSTPSVNTSSKSDLEPKKLESASQLKSAFVTNLCVLDDGNNHIIALLNQED